MSMETNKNLLKQFKSYTVLLKKKSLMKKIIIGRLETSTK